MANGHAIAELRRKRTAYCSRLVVLNHERRTLVANIQKLDDALRLFGIDPGPAAEPKPRLWMFRRGELQRMVCAIIREIGPQIATSAIAAAIIARMAWDCEDRALHALVAGKVKDVRKRLGKRS